MKKQYIIIAVAVLALIGGALYVGIIIGHTSSTHNPAPKTSQQSKTSKPAAAASQAVAHVYHIGDQQCINGLCLTLDSFKTLPPGNSPDSDVPGFELVSVTLTVTNKAPMPPLTDAEKDEGVTAGSLLYASNNTFYSPFTGSVGGGTFTNAIPGYPPTGQTETGTIVFQIPDNTVIDSYLYGNLTWEL